MCVRWHICVQVFAHEDGSPIWEVAAVRVMLVLRAAVNMGRERVRFSCFRGLEFLFVVDGELFKG